MLEVNPISPSEKARVIFNKKGEELKIALTLGFPQGSIGQFFPLPRPLRGARHPF
jgi:hypothetical protein